MVILDQSKPEENDLENINRENCKQNNPSKPVEKVLNDHLNSVDSIEFQVMVCKKFI